MTSSMQNRQSKNFDTTINFITQQKTPAQIATAKKPVPHAISAAP